MMIRSFRTAALTCIIGMQFMQVCLAQTGSHDVMKFNGIPPASFPEVVPTFSPGPLRVLPAASSPPPDQPANTSSSSSQPVYEQVNPGDPNAQYFRRPVSKGELNVPRPMTPDISLEKIKLDTEPKPPPDFPILPDKLDLPITKSLY